MSNQNAVTLTRAQVEELRAIIHNAESPLGNRLQDVSARLYFALDGAGWTSAIKPHPSAPAESGWQPIATAPKDGTRILIWQAGSWQTARWQGHATGAEPSWPVGWRTALYVYPNVEWWAPLPAAPSAAQPGGEGGGHG